MKKSLLLFCLISQPLICLAQSDTIYQWKDSDGVLHFDQHPPAHGAYKTIDPELPTVTPSSPSGVANLPPPAPASEVATQAATSNEPKHTKEECEQFKQELDTLENTPFKRLFINNDQGQEQKMTVEQYQDQQTKYKKLVDECNPG